MEKMLRNKVTILKFLVPGLLVYTLCVAVPIFWSAGYSFFNWKGYGKMEFIGFENYIEMLSDSELWQSVLHTLIYTAIQIVLQVGGGLLLAVLLTKMGKERKFFQVLYYLPVIVSTVALCQMFKKIFAVVPPGLVNQLLSKINPEWVNIQWLTNVKTSLLMVSFTTGYKNMAIYMIIFYAAFLTIPQSLIEAAKIDGAGEMQIFVKIKLPHIRPTIIANMLLVLNGSLRGYDIAKLLTAGGPINSSQLQAMYMYKQAFSSQRYGYGSAIAIFIVVEALALAWIFKFFAYRKDRE